MAPFPAVTQSVLVYNRISNNRRKTWLLVALSIASIIPFVAAIAYGATRTTFSYFVHRTYYSAAQEQQIIDRFESYSPEYQALLRADFDRRMEANHRKRLQEEAGYNRLHTEVLTLFSVAVLAVLGILFWALASSPTSSLLTMCGARPASATGPEAEAKRLLENLAIGAGLPPPKLYIVDSSTPNAFAAGVDPQRSVVGVTSGLLTLMDRRELEGVLAHELSHIGNRDTRLNTIVASIALFMRLPYLFRRQSQLEKSQGLINSGPSSTRRFRIYHLARIPFSLYIFVVAPVIAAAIRAAISRSREFLADADAALLTRYPEGLIRALAKIHGAGSQVSGANPAVSHLYFANPAAIGSGLDLLTGNLMATHPPMDQRLRRLLEMSAGTPASVLENAISAGKDYIRDHPPIEAHNALESVTKGEMAAVTMGNPLGRVCRVTGATEAIPLYDRPNLNSPVCTRIANGDLLVVFDDPGLLRQVLTHNQIFGYMPRSVKLERVDMLPSELHDPAARAAVQAPKPEVRREIKQEIRPEIRQEARPEIAVEPAVAQPATVGASGLTSVQIKIAAIFATAMFGLGLIVVVFVTSK